MITFPATQVTVEVTLRHRSPAGSARLETVQVVAEDLHAAEELAWSRAATAPGAWIVEIVFAQLA